MKQAFVVALLVALGTPLAVNAQGTPTAEQYYIAALENMKHTQQPEQLQYAVTIDMQGGSVLLSRKPDGTLRANFNLDSGAGKQHDRMQIEERPAGTEYRAQLDGGENATSHSPAFNPTWYGLDEWMRYGVGGRPQSAATSPTPQPIASAEPHVIAVATAFSLANYRVHDIGPATCANGDQAHAVSLTPRGDGLVHPLRYAAIDRATGLFCTLRFDIPRRISAPATSTADLEVHLAQIDGFYLIQDERIEATAHLLGFKAGQLDARIAFSGFDFKK